MSGRVREYILAALVSIFARNDRRKWKESNGTNAKKASPDSSFLCTHARSTSRDGNGHGRQIGMDCKDHRPVGRMALPKHDAGLASLRPPGLVRVLSRRLPLLAAARLRVWIFVLLWRLGPWRQGIRMMTGTANTIAF
jgi:hypothetical protein